MLTDQSSHGAESIGTWCKSVPPSESKLSDINCLSNGGKRVAISKTLIEMSVQQGKQKLDIVQSFTDIVLRIVLNVLVAGMKQWFFSKLLANVSFGKYFITKTVVFSPHFSSSLQKCSVVFFFPTFSFVLWSMAPFALGSHRYLLQVAFFHPGAWMAKVSQSQHCGGQTHACLG